MNIKRCNQPKISNREKNSLIILNLRGSIFTCFNQQTIKLELMKIREENILRRILIKRGTTYIIFWG